MNLERIKKRFESISILFSEEEIQGKPCVIAYDKQFKWQWFATQLNTFLFAIDFGNEVITVETIERVLEQSFLYAKQNYNGWPRGFQSGLGVIVIIVSTQIDEHAIEYCLELKSGKKWAGFAVPVVLDSSSSQIHYFKKNPIWGRIYYPYFKDLITEVTQLQGVHIKDGT